MKIRTFCTAIFILCGCWQFAYSQPKPFLPSDFKIPVSFENEQFRIRKLTVNDVVKDYAAVMTSLPHLQSMFPHWSWPDSNLTLDQDLVDLGWHQKEFQLNRSFAYAVVSLDENQVLGGLHVVPSGKKNFDSEIYMWLRSSIHNKKNDDLLFASVKQWISANWPFKRVAYPGREINWDDWLKSD